MSTTTNQPPPVLEPGDNFTFPGLQGICITNLSEYDQGEFTFFNGQEGSDPITVSLKPGDESQQTGYGDPQSQAIVTNTGITQLGLEYV